MAERTFPIWGHQGAKIHITLDVTLPDGTPAKFTSGELEVKPGNLIINTITEEPDRDIYPEADRELILSRPTYYVEMHLTGKYLPSSDPDDSLFKLNHTNIKEDKT